MQSFLPGPGEGQGAKKEMLEQEGAGSVRTWSGLTHFGFLSAQMNVRSNAREV